jgi:hypothetical protein
MAGTPGRPPTKSTGEDHYLSTTLCRLWRLPRIDRVSDLDECAVPHRLRSVRVRTVGPAQDNDVMDPWQPQLAKSAQNFAKRLVRGLAGMSQDGHGCGCKPKHLKGQELHVPVTSGSGQRELQKICWMRWRKSKSGNR